MNIQSSKISTKGQITIPKDFRDELDLKPGDELFLIKTEDGILIKPKKSNLKVLRGLMSEEINIEEAENFLQNERKKWSLENAKISR